jgi:two-component system response regulator VicR
MKSAVGRAIPCRFKGTIPLNRLAKKSELGKSAPGNLEGVTPLSPEIVRLRLRPTSGAKIARESAPIVRETVLIVEDDESIAEFLTVTLSGEGYRVVIARDGREAVERFELDKPDAVLLDMMLPRLSGLEVLRTLRRSSETPILIVSVKDSESDKVSTLELGADDYITKPFSPRELVARLRTNLRKRGSGEVRVRLGDVEIDWQRADVYKSGVRIILTAREFEVLRVLYDHRERVLGRESLLEKVWGFDFEGEDRVVDTTIKRLRKKVGSELVETVRGLGYRLSVGR